MSWTITPNEYRTWRVLREDAGRQGISRLSIAEIQELRLALGEPVPELAKTTALVLYFPDQAAADGFEKLVTEAMPGLKARTLR